MNPEIQITNLALKWASMRLDTANWMLRCTSIEIRQGTIYSLLGENMSGKSTFMEFILGNREIETVDSTNPAVSLPRPDFPVCNRIHHADVMFPSFSLMENVLVPITPWNFGKERHIRSTFVQYLRSHSAFDNVSHKTKLRDISSGAVALVKLFRASILRPAILLIDEVTANLDSKNTTYFINTLCEMLSPPQSAIIVSHDHKDHLELKKAFSDTTFDYRKLVCTRKGNHSCLSTCE